MIRKLLLTGTVMLVTGFSILAWGEATDTTATPLIHYKRFSEAKVAPVPSMPECTKLVMLRGNPATGPSSMIARMDSGCVCSSHWHSANEETLVSKGTIQVQIDGKPTVELKAGSYMLLPAKTIHRFRCISKEDCWMYDTADAPFDVHNVDASGKEISAEEAIKAAAELSKQK